MNTPIRVGRIKYTCIKCGSKEMLDYFPDIRTGEYNPMLNNLMDTKLCLDCYTEEYIPEAADILMEEMA